MFLLYFLVALLVVLVALSTSCSLGKVRGCDVGDNIEICAGDKYNKSDWLPVCHEYPNDIVRCQGGLCGKFPLELMGKKGKCLYVI